MPNPVIPLKRTHMLTVQNRISPAGKSYAYPAVETGADGKQRWVCRVTGISLLSLTERGSFSYLLKDGLRHMPYHPKVDNDDPLPYKMVSNFYTNPVLNSSLVTVQSIGSSPISCSSFQEPNHAFGGPMWTVSLPHLDPSTDLENRVISILNSRLDKSKEVTVNYAMNYAERRESIDMVTKRARQLSKSLSLLRKGKYEKAYYELFGSEKKFRGKRSKDRAANLWLEWSLGWSPLLGDIHNAVSDFFKDPPPTRLRVSARARDQRNDVQTSSVSFAITSRASVNAPFTVNVERSVSVTYISYYKMNMPKLVNLSSAGVADPATVLWELVPFSFVADWFVNIGDVIRDYSIAHGLDHLSTIKSVKRTMSYRSEKRTNTYTHTSGPNGVLTSVVGSVDVVGDYVQLDRTVSAYRPRLALQINSDPISWRRALTALALANNLLKGFGR